MVFDSAIIKGSMKNAKIFKSIHIERGGESIEKDMGDSFSLLNIHVSRMW